MTELIKPHLSIDLGRGALGSETTSCRHNEALQSVICRGQAAEPRPSYIERAAGAVLPTICELQLRPTSFVRVVAGAGPSVARRGQGRRAEPCAWPRPSSRAPSSIPRSLRVFECSRLVETAFLDLEAGLKGLWAEVRTVFGKDAFRRVLRCSRPVLGCFTLELCGQGWTCALCITCPPSQQLAGELFGTKGFSKFALIET